MAPMVSVPVAARALAGVGVALLVKAGPSPTLQPPLPVAPGAHLGPPTHPLLSLRAPSTISVPQGPSAYPQGYEISVPTLGWKG